MVGENIDSTRPTVLVVDDDVETAQLFTDFLSDDYAVRTAYSGEEALELLDSDVSVVLLDRRLPGLSGDEVLSRIQADRTDCRIVMTTALDPDIDSLSLPFDDYLVKPISQEEVRDAVSRMQERHSCDEQIQEIFALVSKMATLESKLSIPEMEASSEYASLEARFAELHTETDLSASANGDYPEFTAEKIRALFS